MWCGKSCACLYVVVPRTWTGILYCGVLVLVQSELKAISGMQFRLAVRNSYFYSMFKYFYHLGTYVVRVGETLMEDIGNSRSNKNNRRIGPEFSRIQGLNCLSPEKWLVMNCVIIKKVHLVSSLSATVTMALNKPPYCIPYNRMDGWLGMHCLGRERSM